MEGAWPASVAGRVSWWLEETCTYVQADLVPFYDEWGVTTRIAPSARAIDTCRQFVEWVGNPLLVSGMPRPPPRPPRPPAPEPPRPPLPSLPPSAPPVPTLPVVGMFEMYHHDWDSLMSTLGWNKGLAERDGLLTIALVLSGPAFPVVAVNG